MSMNYTPIRQVQTRRDVAAIADLVELCFAEYMDPDGREYLRYLRRISMQSFGLVADSPVLSMPEKIRLSCTINRLLVREGLVCDVLLQSEQEARDKASCTASIVREALREGVPV